MGGVDHLAVADVYADMGDVDGSTAEEDEVAGFERVVGSELGGGVVLVLGDPGQGDPGDPVSGLDQARAVEADAGRLAAPYVRSTDLGEGPVGSDPSRCAGGNRLGLGLTIMPMSA